jgi:hypothetical protein
MNLGANSARLAALTKDLLLKWDETRNYWKDARSREFEQKYIEEIRARVDTAAATIEKLDELLTRVRNDCE